LRRVTMSVVTLFVFDYPYLLVQIGTCVVNRTQFAPLSRGR